MQLVVLVATVLASVAASALANPLVGRQNYCDEAARFGGFQISPSTLAAGDAFTINASFPCAAYFDIYPVYIDYVLEVPEASNNGYEPNLLLARRGAPTVPSGQTVPVDIFNSTLPFFQYFADAPYQVNMVLTYPVDSGEGTQTFIQVELSQGINITGGVVPGN